MIVVIFRIGIDDTDTSSGYCTTFVATLLLEEALRLGFEIIDFPHLVRLNPNIPYKTRGNAAVALILKGEIEKVEILFKKFEEICEGLIDEKADKPNPVMAFYNGDQELLREFYNRCLVSEISIEETMGLARKLGIKFLALRGVRGLIGAIAAIGANLDEFTYELLAYRDPNDKGRERGLSYAKVLEMDRLFKKYTFHNIDEGKKRILITPHGRDPVLVGIRGSDPDKLIEAFKFLGIQAQRWLIFKTNQGTDAHLKEAMKNENFARYGVIYEEAKIKDRPKVMPGGHVILDCLIKGKHAEALVYSESGAMNKLARYLHEGDLVRIGGGIKEIGASKMTINVERIEILSLSDVYLRKRPVCARCGSRLKSAGSGKGLICKNCKIEIPFEFHILTKIERPLMEGQVLLPPPRSRRHLTKPIEGNYQGIRKEFSLDYFYSKFLFPQKESVVNLS